MLTIPQCLEALQSVLGKAQELIPLHEPHFSQSESEKVQACINSGWVSSVGEYVNAFEKHLVDYTGSPYAVAVVNGTAALHMCLMLVDVKQNDEVLIPALTFVATANAVMYCGAIPHFIDSHAKGLGIDIEKLEIYLRKIAVVKDQTCFNKLTNRRIVAIVPVHIFGHSVDMDALQELCKAYHISIVEDASESLGSYYKGKHTGNFGEVACLSFNGNKIITTGGGGAILTKNATLAARAKYLTTTAKRAHQWEFYHDEVGYNYRLPNINAALGCAQMEQLDSFIEKKRRLHQRYIKHFSNIPRVSILTEQDFSKCNYWLNALILDQPDRKFVCGLIEQAQIQQYGLRGLWTPLDGLPMYQSCPKMDLSATYALFDQVIALPSSAHLEKNHV